MVYPWHLYAMATLYIVAGMFHFIKPKMYLRIMPNYVPNHKLMVFLSGIAEVILGISLCFPLLKNVAIFLIISMLFIFLSVHIYMLTNKKAAAGLPRWALILRIPMQFVLMFWAYSYLQL